MDKHDAPDADPFAPLSDEKARRERVDTGEVWEPILPAPVEPPDARQIKHWKHGPATSSWVYRDTTGEPLFVAARFDLPNSDKEVLPFTYGRRVWKAGSSNRQEKTGWHFKRPNPPVPIYGLDRLAARTGAPVLVTEGEKKADAAEKLFPAIVAVTSQGGAGSAAAGDWSALNGREVTIWPDRDTAGDRYATDVTRLAQQAGAASVHVVVVPQDWPDGWDLADEPPEGVTVEQLALMYSEARLPNEVIMPPGFTLGSSGLNFRPDPTDTAVFVAAPFDVIGEANDGAGIAWGLVMRWRDRDGRPHQWSCPKRLVHGDGNAIAAELEDAGLQCGTSRAAHDHLKHFIGAVRASQRLRCVDSTGWHVTDRGPVFVLPGGETFGPGAGSVILQSDRMGGYDAFRSAGTLEGWQDAVARCAVANDRLVVFISARFAAPLLDVMREPGGGLHLFGASQIGKTIVLRSAASVWGPADPSGQLRDWRATSNGLEGVAAESNDVGLCLDELGQANGGDAADAAYMLANGGGKSRAARDGSVRQRRRWRSIVLSTGEMPLEVKIAEAGRRPMAGQDVRLASLRGDAGVGLGIFQDTHGMKDAGAIARHLQDTTQAHFGTAGRAFVTKLAAERGSDPEGLVEAVKAMRDAFVASYLPCGADGQVRSVCARFGVMAAAGELARVFGVVPWPEGEATRASAACFKSWLADRGGYGAAEDVKAMRQVRAFIEAHGTSRFEEIGDDIGPPSDLRTYNRAGFRRRGPNGWTYLIFPQVWRDDVCHGLDHQRTAKLLASRHLLTSDPDGRPDRKESVPKHGRPRFFVVVGAILEASDE